MFDLLCTTNRSRVWNGRRYLQESLPIEEDKLPEPKEHYTTPLRVLWWVTVTEARMNFQLSCGASVFQRTDVQFFLPPNSFFEPVDGLGEKEIDI